MDYTYSYLIGTIFPLLIWFLLYILRKNIRKEMWQLSTIAFVVGPIISFFLVLLGWWHPQTITRTMVGIEDSLYAFAITGISASIYQFVFKKNYSEMKEKPKINLILFCLINVLIFIPLSFLLGPIYGSFVQILLAWGYIAYKRKDLIKSSLWSALFVTILSIPAYFIVEYFTPGWIINTWYLENISGIFLWNIPIEDYVWHFLAGGVLSMVYKYVKGLKENV